MSRADERLEAVESAANAFMAAFEAGEVDALNAIWRHVDREAMVTLLAGWLSRTESRLEGAERRLHLTRDIKPAGLSRAAVARIALKSDERRNG